MEQQFTVADWGQFLTWWIAVSGEEYWANSWLYEQKTSMAASGGGWQSKYDWTHSKYIQVYTRCRTFIICVTHEKWAIIVII